MKTFTFLVNANDKHCFVHQYQSEMPTNDLFRELVHDPPTKLNGLSNVWCTCFIVFSTLLLLNIVETVKKTTNKTS